MNKQDAPVIIGAGLAGLMAALHLAPQPCIVLTSAPLGDQAASAWAQGGLAAAIGEDDSTDLHLADTLIAGDGLCNEAVARRIVEAGPALVEELVRLGAGSTGQRPAGLAWGWRRATAAAASCTRRAIPADAKYCAPSSPLSAPRRLSPFWNGSPRPG